MANQKLEIEINGQTAQLERSLKNVNTFLQHTKREAKALNNDLKFEPGNTDLLVRQQQKYAEAVNLSREKVKLLQEELDGVDIEVSPVKFEKLANQIDIANRETKTLERSFDNVSKAVNRLQTGASSIKLDTGNGIKEFQNSLRGIKAAMSTISKVSELTSFDKSTASASQLSAHMREVNTAMSLLSSKAAILQDDLKDLDPQINPEGFTKAQNELKKVQAELQALEKVRVNPRITTSNIVNDANAARNSINQNIGRSLAFNLGSSGVDAAKNMFNNIKGFLSNVAPNISNAVRVTFSGFANVMRSVGSASWNIVKTTMSAGLQSLGTGLKTIANSVFGSVGNAIKSAITAPLSGIKNAMGTIIQGGLLTIGNKLTTGLGSTFSGVMSSMQETSTSAKSLENVLSFAGVDTSVIQSLKSDMADYAKTTSFGSSELNKIVSGLTTAGVAADKTGALTKNIANSYALLGDGSRKVSEIGTIFTQINSAGKLLAQDFNQLRDAGLGGAIKQDIEKNFPSVIAQFGSFAKAMEAGAISSEMVNESISRIGSSDAAVQAATVPKTMKAAFESLTETIGQKFQSVFEKVNQSGINFVSGLTGWVDNLDLTPFVSMLENMFESLNSVKSVMGSLAGSINVADIFTNISANVKTAVDAFKSFAASSDSSTIVSNLQSVGSSVLSTFGNIGTALQSAFNGIAIGPILRNVSDDIAKIFNSIELFSQSTGFKTFLRGTFVVMASLLTNVSSLIENLVSKTGALLGGIDFTSFTSTLVQAISVVKNVFDQVIGTLFNTFSSLRNSIDFGSLFGGFLETLATVGRIITNVFDLLVSGLQNSNISEAFKSVGDSIGVILSSLEELSKSQGLKTVIEVIGTFVAESFRTIFSLVEQTLNAVNTNLGSMDFTTLSTGISGFGEIVRNVFGYLLDVIGVTVNSVSEALANIDFKGWFDSISESLTGVGDTIKTLFDSTLFKSLIEGVVSVLGSLVVTITNIVAQIADIFVNLFKGFDLTSITEPLQVWIDIVNSFWTNVFAPIKTAIDEMNSNGTLAALWEQFKNLGKSLSDMLTFFKPLTDFLGKIIGWIVGESLKGIVDFITAFVKGINDFIDAIKVLLDVSSNIGKGVMDWISGLLGLNGSGSGASYGGASSYYSAYSGAVTNSSTSTTNNVNVNVSAPQGVDVNSLARAVVHEINLGTV